MVVNKEKGAGAAKGSSRRKENISRKKHRHVDETTQDEVGTVADEEEQTVDEPAPEESVAEVSDEKVDEPPEGKDKRHIHPCVCDLSPQAIQRIQEFTDKKKALYQKFVQRKAEIEEELRQKELERQEREREKSEQKELFGDEYETTEEGLKKRKKRSARRVSMVSLGVRQVINWKREPRVPVKYNVVWKLRYENSRYCAKQVFVLPCPEEIDWKKEPAIPIRLTVGSKRRQDMSHELKNKLIEAEDKRTPFILHYIP